MNDLIANEIDTATTEILILKQQTAQNIIEIGKRLIAVKEKLPHGEWGNWLKEKVDFSHTSAKRFMQVAREFSNGPTLGDLPQSKVFALLDLPPEDREEFIKSNPVDDMTTRELQKAIKDLQDTIKDRDLFKAKLETSKKAVDRLALERDALKETLQAERASKKDEVKYLVDKLNAAQEDGSSAEKIKQLETELKNAKYQVDKLTEQINEPVTIETAIVEKVPEEVERELAELREKVKTSSADPSVLKFKIQFDALVTGFNGLLVTLDEIKDSEVQVKYKNAVNRLIGKMTERL